MTLAKWLENHPKAVLSFEFGDYALFGQEYLINCVQSGDAQDRENLDREIRIERFEAGNSKKLAYPQMYLLDSEGYNDTLVCWLDAPLPVIFRVWRDDVANVIAIMPTMQEDAYKVVCYQHLGQHGACDHSIIEKTRIAKPEEYAKLHTELESIGYRMRIIKRWPSWRSLQRS